MRHRAVMERCIGAPIPPGMIVHHVNEDRTDNRPENLKLMTHAEHSAHHNQKHPLVKRCEVCGCDFTPAPTKRARAKTCGARACELRRCPVGRAGRRCGWWSCNRGRSTIQD